VLPGAGGDARVAIFELFTGDFIFNFPAKFGWWVRMMMMVVGNDDGGGG